MQLYRKTTVLARQYARLIACNTHIIPLTARPNRAYYGINTFTPMPDHTDPSTKRQALQASGTFNPRHARVRHPLFQNSEFFDPQDLLQLKYESLRALKQDDYSIAKAAGDFGLSRPTLYHAQAHFQGKGLEGLMPAKRGPRQGHKLTPEVLEYLRELSASQPELSASQLARQVRQRFKIKVHPRTIEKALKPKAKRGRHNSP
jgi:transposase